MKECGNSDKFSDDEPTQKFPYMKPLVNSTANNDMMMTARCTRLRQKLRITCTKRKPRLCYCCLLIWQQYWLAPKLVLMKQMMPWRKVMTTHWLD